MNGTAILWTSAAPSAPTTWFGGFIAQEPTLTHCLKLQRYIPYEYVCIFIYIYNIARSCCMVIANWATGIHIQRIQAGCMYLRIYVFVHIFNHIYVIHIDKYIYIHISCVISFGLLSGYYLSGAFAVGISRLETLTDAWIQALNFWTFHIHISIHSVISVYIYILYYSII